MTAETEPGCRDLSEHAGVRLAQVSAAVCARGASPTHSFGALETQVGPPPAPPWKPSGSLAATLDVSGPDSAKPGFGPGQWEVSPLKSLLKQVPGTPDPGRSRASPPPSG